VSWKQKREEGTCGGIGKSTYCRKPKHPLDHSAGANRGDAQGVNGRFPRVGGGEGESSNGKKQARLLSRNSRLHAALLRSKKGIREEKAYSVRRSFKAFKTPRPLERSFPVKARPRSVGGEREWLMSGGAGEFSKNFESISIRGPGKKAGGQTKSV